MATDSFELVVVFWQNCVSIHQYPLLKELHHAGVRVIQVVEETLMKERAAMGWNLPNAPYETLLFDDALPAEIVKKYPNAKHVFTGFNGFKKVSVALRFIYGIAPSSCYVFQERPDLRGVKGKLRFLLYGFYCYRYRKAAGILAAGSVKLFNGMLWRAPVHAFPYFVYPPQQSTRGTVGIRNRVRFVYVGSLIERKNIIGMCNALQCVDAEWELVVIGDGPEKTHLLNLQMKRNDCRVHLCGVLTNDKIGDILFDSDCLVLPSSFDGYGVVVNEAVLCGLRLICSVETGASEFLGGIDALRRTNWFFSPKHHAQFVDCISGVIGCGVLGKEEREQRKGNGAALHPRSGAACFMEYLNA